MTTSKIMVAIGVLAVHLGLARGIFLRSSLAFGYLLPPFLCCELGWWARSRTHGPGRTFWTSFILSSLAAWLAFILIECALIEDARLAPLFIAEAIYQLAFGRSELRHTLALENPISHFTMVLAIIFALGLFVSFFLQSMMAPITPGDQRAGIKPQKGDEQPGI